VQKKTGMKPVFLLHLESLGQILGRRPITAKTIANIIPTTNKIQAMFVAAPAIPVKPNTAANKPMIKNAKAHPNMVYPPHL
jgi:hypothetical protein